MTSTAKNKQSGRIWLFAAAVLLFTAVVMFVFIRQDSGPDDTVFVFIAPYRTSGFTDIMNFISFYGNHNFLVPANLLLVIYFFVKKNKPLAILTLITALSSLGLMSLIKNMVQRHRPSDPLVAGVTNYSFPSGHAFMSVAFYGLLIWLVLTYTTQGWKQRAWVALLLLLILIIGFSRIYLRMHYTSDVVAGLCLGTIWLLLLLTLADWWNNRRQKLV
jgi:undecaprenyl-diphosphatase